MILMGGLEKNKKNFWKRAGSVATWPKRGLPPKGTGVYSVNSCILAFYLRQKRTFSRKNGKIEHFTGKIEHSPRWV